VFQTTPLVIARRVQRELCVQLHIRESITTIVSMGLRLTAHQGMTSTVCFAGIITAAA
jgi:hypothetical protein